ncbi:MAG: CPBP family intramembrane glutamic endopeptidase [Balneolales bacterium]
MVFWIFSEEGITRAFEHGLSVPVQLPVGVAAGSLAALMIRFIAARPPVSGVLNDFYIYRTFLKVRLTTFDRIQLSLFAGTGEELLFRGAIQPLLGIWFTSVIFVAIHGYFSFKSTGHLLFGTIMLGLSLLLGFLFEYTGLIAAMSAHTIYDMIMLNSVKKKGSEL